ncbi:MULTISPECIES: SulP family inorganic anion transporter [unclassified Variovorax]|uniref:SulP family inorganic anion transporter n=1 Tax=unclassified Variovorax TaxID=663243 RepID=UPI0009FE2C10|nr:MULTISPECIES: SulP family inorganic anion transporter [unclassified Variovorax]
MPRDLVAGLVVTILLVSQSLAYAMLAGLPPHVGMYASILPLVAYAVLGSSMTLSVGSRRQRALPQRAALCGQNLSRAAADAGRRKPVLRQHAGGPRAHRGEDRPAR